MFCRCRRVCGSFLLNQRLVADWWQAGAREEVHQAAKARLEAALEEVRASTTAPSTSDGDAASTAVRRAPPLSLYEANGLVATFVSAHNTPDVSTTLQYIREELGEELSPYHFHALLRCFNYHYDTANALQLLEVMAQSGTTTLETYARLADGVHALAPPDSQARLMELVGLAQDAFGTLVMENGAGSEAATIAAYGLSEDGRAARLAAAAADEVLSRSAAAAAAGDEPGAAAALPSSQAAAPVRSAPLLSSLLYHYSTVGQRDGPVACVIVSLWIRALGVALSEWDVLAVLTSVLACAEEFPRFCALFSCFDAFERGTVGVEAVVRRLVQLREVAVPQPSGTDSQSLLSDATGGAEESRGNASAPLLTSLVTTMLTSLHAAGVDAATAVVSLSFINAQTNSMSELVTSTLRPLVATGVGPHGYNAGQLFHAVSLLHSSLGDDTSAIEMFVRAAREQQRCAAATAASEVERGIAGPAAAAPHFPPWTPLQTSNAAQEPFAVPVHHALDVGTLLSHVSATTLRDIRGPFRAATRHLAGESPPRVTNTPASSSGPGLVWCAPGPASRRELSLLSSLDASFIETLPEARAMLRRAVEAVGGSGGLQGRTPSRVTQAMFLQLAQLCCRHPPRNPKLTPVGLEERIKWGRYLDARDASLALFGSARQSRDAMKHLFYNDNKLPALRSEQVIAKDFSDVYDFFVRFSPTGRPDVPSTLPQAELQAAMMRTRTTLPHTGSSSLAVPRYLWDPEMFNPYPAANLPLNTAALVGAEPAFTSAEVHQTGNGLVEDAEADADGLPGFFVELWRALLDTTSLESTRDVWYLQNTELYMLLVRCLLHRLDWEAAAHLTRIMTQHASYTYLMDHELTIIFREIGDPAGCLAFKVATKLFDGRITRDGQEKRDKFHQDQTR